MYGFLTSQNSQYYEGTYYARKTDTQGTIFRYDRLTNMSRTFGTIINNLIATQGRLTIKTNYKVDFKVNGFVVDKNGNKWIIAQIEEMEQEVNPQTRYWLRQNPDTDYVLSLIKVENIEGLV